MHIDDFSHSYDPCSESISKTLRGNLIKFETLIAGNDRKCKAHVLLA